MNNEQDIARLELTMEEAQRQIALGESFDALVSNPHFTKLITEGYFQDRARELVLMRGDPGIEATPGELDRVLKDIDGVASLWQYFQAIRNIAASAKGAMVRHEETMEEMLAEDLQANETVV